MTFRYVRVDLWLEDVSCSPVHDFQLWKDFARSFRMFHTHAYTAFRINAQTGIVTDERRVVRLTICAANSS